MTIPIGTMGLGGAAHPRPARSWRRYALEWAAAVALASQEMSFLEHLDELRRRLIWSLASVVVAFGACWVFSAELYEIASAPIRATGAATLSITHVQDIVGLYIKVTLVAAIFVSAPFVLTQAWLFISPGLYSHERRYAIPFVLSAYLLFLVGGVFGYFVAFPAALRFMLQWIADSQLAAIIDVGGYFDLFFAIMVALGITFQIPAVMFVLARIGLIDAPLLLRNSKLAVLGSVIVAAIITPTPDPWNMLIIAGPMIVLYGVGIVVAWIFGRRRREA